MKKGIITIILTFILIFNTYSPTFATTPDPAAAIPVTAYEVYTYFTLVLTYMGVEYKNAQERKQWLEDEYGPNTPTYQSVEDILRKAKINFLNEPPNYNPKPEPRQIAIPVPDSIIDSLFNKLKNLIGKEVDLTPQLTDLYNRAYNYKPTARNFVVYKYIDSANSYDLYAIYLYNDRSFWQIIPGVENGVSFNNYRAVYNSTSGLNYDFYGYTRISFYNNGSIKSSFNDTKFANSSGIGTKIYTNDKYEMILDDSFEPIYQITLPFGDFKKSWISPYTGMQTVTMPLTTTGIESPIEVPVIPGEYVEPAPDEVTNPITQPVNDPLINPETGLPFIDPETGLPIFPSTPIVPVTPITPIPEPEELTQPKDYTPKLTEISNGIKQLPERIINPIKKLFIPDKVSEIDFSPLNVPITKKFPFCIPFDLANMFQNFSAGGEPPKWDINLVFMDYSETVTIDLARFEKWAEITRFFVFIAFNIGLILVTRNLIRG